METLLGNRSNGLLPHADDQFDVPVLFIIFNRPKLTRRVFEAIRQAKPKRLYIAADGPRAHKPGDEAACKEARAIVNLIDWDCRVQTLYRATNMGCGKGPATAITWFFENEAEGIILEDDCLPSPSFFPFCAELLERYRDDTRVMQIGGTNLEPVGQRDEAYSYRYSNMVYIWGWATWRRAWKLHDFYMNHYPEIKEKGYLTNSYDTFVERDYNTYVFGKMYTGDESISSKTIWDFQWQFACKIHSGLIIVPNRNLIQNLGFGAEATNTLDPSGQGHDLALEKMEFPLKHPDFMMVDQVKENLVFRTLSTSLTSRIKSRLKSWIPNKVLDGVLMPVLRMFA